MPLNTPFPDEENKYQKEKAAHRAAFLSLEAYSDLHVFVLNGKLGIMK